MQSKPTTTRPRRLRRWILRGVVVMSSGLVALLACELVLRLVMQPRPPMPEPQVAYQRFECDPTTGRAASYWLLRGEPKVSHSFDAEVRTTARGFRGHAPEAAGEFPGDGLRVVALGDSHTFGVGVRSSSTWPARLEQELKSKISDRRVEVVNAGMPALNVEQEVSLFLERCLPLDPDVVVVAYYWNDMPEWGEPTAPFAPGDPIVPPTMRPPKPETNRAATPPTPRARGLTDVVKDALRESYLAYLVVQKMPFLQHSFFPSTQTRWRCAVLDGTPGARLDGSWGFVESQLKVLADISRERGFRLVIAPVPLFEQMTAGYTDLSGYQDRVAAICGQIGAEFVDPLPRILELEPSYPRDFVPFDGHPTDRIYGAFAEAIAEHLLR